jgi:murein hydrolase activator
MRRRLRSLVIVCAGGLAGIASGQAATPEGLDAAARRLTEAEAVLEAAQDTGAAPTALADAIARYDAVLADVRGTVLQAGAQETETRLRILRESRELSQLLATLERVSMAENRPSGLHPDGPIAAARVRMMAEALRPLLSARADEVSARLAALSRARSRQDEGIRLLERGLARLAAARAGLLDRLQFQTEYGRPVDAELAVALVEADSLADLTAALDRARAPQRGSSGAAGPRLWPVETHLLRTFNERDAAGVRWPGVVLSAPPLSLVRAPDAARVLYAGPFLDYRSIVVLETPEPALVILANLADLIVRTGDRVARGAPLGILGGRSPGVEEYVKLSDGETGSGLREALYIEVRDGGGPVDPVSWFGGTNG